jgi:hypothetical protein
MPAPPPLLLLLLLRSALFLLPIVQVNYVGQPLGLVLAKTLSAAREGAARVQVTYAPVSAPTAPPDSGSASCETALMADPASAAAAAGNHDDTTLGPTAAAAASSTAPCNGVTSLAAAAAANSWYNITSPSMQASCGELLPEEPRHPFVRSNFVAVTLSMKVTCLTVMLCY